MILPPPKLTVTGNADVTTLLNYYKKKFISKEELSRLFNEVVRWDYRSLQDPLNWEGLNTWAKVYAAVQKGVISHEDYMFLSQSYETYLDEREREKWKI